MEKADVIFEFEKGRKTMDAHQLKHIKIVLIVIGLSAGFLKFGRHSVYGFENTSHDTENTLLTLLFWGAVLAHALVKSLFKGHHYLILTRQALLWKPADALLQSIPVESIQKADFAAGAVRFILTDGSIVTIHKEYFSTRVIQSLYPHLRALLGADSVQDWDAKPG